MLLVSSLVSSYAMETKPCEAPCEVYKLGQPGYEKVRFVKPDDSSMDRIGNINTLFNSTKPALIMIAKSDSDVVSGVKWAIANKVKATARSGGHSYTGCSLLKGGLVIDVSQLDSVESLPNGFAKVGAGAKLGKIYDELLKGGRALPAGSCRTVGIAGLALGGGHGVLARESGMTVDRIVSMEVVTADGNLRNVSAETDKDLFWGLRGGGQNLGVVTSFTFATVKTRLSFFYAAKISWNADLAINWQTWAHDEPAASWHSLHLSRGHMKLIGVYSANLCAPDCTQNLCTKDSDCLHIQGSYCQRGICHGTDLNTTYIRDRLVNGHKIFDWDLELWDWEETVANLDWTPQNLPHAWTAKSLYVMPQTPLNKTALDIMDTTLQTAPAGVTAAINWDAYGGVIKDVASNATAFAYRNALMSVQSINELDSTANINQTKNWLKRFSSAISPWDKGAYINYADTLDMYDRESQMKEYFGSNVQALHIVKNKYDPSGLFGYICSGY